MKKVLCFGDSNVYGYVPESGQRYSKAERWTGILDILGENKFQIVEAGCNNRTAFKDNPCGAQYTGYKAISKHLKESFDVVILAIGINDIQFLYNTSLEEVSSGMTKLVNIVQQMCPDSTIVLCSPSVLKENVLKGAFSVLFDETSINKSKHLPEIYRLIAEKTGVEFVNLNDIVEVSSFDGLHYTKESHKKIAEYLFDNFFIRLC